MKNSNLKVLWRYLKNDKFKLIIYIIMIFLTYLPIMITPIFEGKAVEYLIYKDFSNFTLYLTLWIGINLFVWSILQIPKDYLYNYLEIKFMKNVSKDLYKKIDLLPALAFEEIGVGEFINRLYTDPDRVMELLAKIIKLICKSIIILIVIYISFNISIILGLEVFIFAIVMGVVSYKFFPKIKKTQERIKKESDNYVKIATENITGIREIKALGIKSIIEKNIFNNIDELYKNTSKIKKFEIVYYNINNLLYYVLEFIIFFTAGYLLVKGKITYSVFIMLESYIWRIDEVVESISDFGVNYNKVKVSLKRIDEILNNKLYSDEKYGNKTLDNCYGVVKFDNVKFKYREDEEYTLKGLNLVVEPNKKIAIVGKSGNGKSTLFNLLLRYFDSTKGNIYIDNINIKDLSEKSLRDNISIIRQTPFLFNMSVLDNFKIVKENITLDELRDVCKKAYIDDYIMSLPNKYDTIIGEGGVNLSGGQKQRLAIARTLLINTKIILFDEATSALDNESQEYIKKTIDNLVKDHTVIIVAHRLSTIIDADIINVIEDGMLVASGTHNELLNNSNSYKKLYMNETLE